MSSQKGLRKYPTERLEKEINRTFNWVEEFEWVIKQIRTKKASGEEAKIMERLLKRTIGKMKHSNHELDLLIKEWDRRFPDDPWEGKDETADAA